MSKTISIFLLLVIFMPLSAQEPAISRFQFRKVAEIRIQADGPVDETFLRSLIEITPGVDILTPSKIRRSIELLYRTGEFTNILVDAEMVGEEVRLTFQLRLIYRFEFIHLKGDMGVSSAKLRKKLQLRKLEPYTPEKVLKGREDLLFVLRDNGYYRARVLQDVLLHRTTRRAEVTYTIQAGPPTYIGTLEYTGTPFFSRNQLLKVVDLHPGDRFREHEMNQDMEKLEQFYDRNGFLEHNIKILRRDIDSSNRIHLVIHIDAGKQLVLQTQGMDVSMETLREELPIWTDHSYDDDTLEEGRRNLIRYLQSRGFYQAAVTWKKEISAEKILVRYSIEPGMRYAVDEIYIGGNQYFTDGQIGKMMQTKESSIFRSGRMVDQQFFNDISRIISAYKEQGFLFVRIKERKVQLRPDGKIILVLEIEEGDQVLVSDIRLTGNQVISSDFFLQNFQQKVGEPISESKVKADSNYIISLYSDRGYPQVRLENKVTLSSDRKRATIFYTIFEGNQIFVDRIVISGNYRTRRDVILENLLFEEDDPLSLRKIAESQGRLYAMDIFDRVETSVPRPDNLHKHQDIFIRLTESKPYTVSYGLGYQTFDKLRGIFSISNRNLLGTDRELTLQLRGGFKEWRSLLSYEDPHLFHHTVDSRLTGFAEHRVLRKEFSFRRFGISLETERKLTARSRFVEAGPTAPPVMSLFFRYDLEDIDTQGEPILNEIERRFLAIHISSLSVSFVRDARNDFIDPHYGHYFTSELQWATHFLGSEPDFVKFFTQFQYYIPVTTKTVLASSLRIGLARGFEETVKLPISQRFFAGGGRTIRGFELDTAGPLDPLGQPLGGNGLLILNLEYRFPIFGPLGGVLFFDDGNVFETVNHMNLKDLRETAGAGIRYATPIGPLTLDWGYKLDRKRVPIRESPWEFFISVGHAF